MRSAVVFYSYDGNSTFVAEQVRSLLNADMIHLQLQDEKRRRGFAKFCWGGSMAIFGKKPPLKPYSFDPSVYDLIVIGGPVWAGTPCPAIRSFLAQTAITGKKVALFACHEGGLGKALEKLKTMLAGNTIAAAIDFIKPAAGNRDHVKHKIAEWVTGLEA